MADKQVTGEPRLASFASWLVLAASFGLSTGTWIALAVLAGFTGKATIGEVTLHQSWLLPLAVDGYVVIALVLWMSSVPAKVAAFAKKNTYGAAGIGIAAQSAYHALTIWTETEILWRAVFAAVIGALPPTVAGLAVHMRALIRRERGTAAPLDTQHTNETVVTPHDATRTPGHDAASTYGLAANTVPEQPPGTTSDDDNRPAEPASVAAPALTQAVTPTPAELAERVRPRPIHATPTAPAAVPGPAARPGPARPTSPTTPAQPLAPPASDPPVISPASAQHQQPLVDPALLDRARTIARQYLADTGMPIIAGQLALRLRVSSETATQILTVIGNDHPTVNGHRPAKATR
ncbi:hypothetical protein ACFO1B_44215 [Dactylosporangium siamense]|uniref:DUF2637 domain-containing protein n=1 Tax=Dactylosporangium siamense TaxID=685454 RepID=A0A919PVA9_9ACTN|nr:hypothetical protein [Dactylosporangium siamense]GIG51166.1 hypothetical protein Dsi01nite_092070 [Dactylosporangium siamense]